MSGGGSMEQVGKQALWVLLVVWLYFIVRYFTGLRLPPALDAVMVILGIAAGIGVFLWLWRGSRNV
jgi:hypothetical protein